MRNITNTLDRTDWKLLRDQKLGLLEAIGMCHELQLEQHLVGLLNWIDAVQDAAELDGFPVVFTTDEVLRDA